MVLGRDDGGGDVGLPAKAGVLGRERVRVYMFPEDSEPPRPPHVMHPSDADFHGGHNGVLHESNRRRQLALCSNTVEVEVLQV